MKAWHYSLSILFGFILYPVITLAEGNNDVTQWVEKTLISTLTIGYQETNQDILNKSRKFYTTNAWDGLVSFLGNRAKEAQQEKVNTEPRAKAPAEIIQSGVFSGITYWKVQQTIMFPQIGGEVQFTVNVVKTNPYEGTQYMIQSINMIKHKF